MTTKDEQQTGEDEDFGAAFRDSSEGKADDDPFGTKATGEEEQVPGEEASGEAPATPKEPPESATAADGGVPEDHGTPADEQPQARAEPEAQPPETPPASEQLPATPPEPPPPSQQPSTQQPPPAEPEPAKDWTEYLSEEEKQTLSTYDDEWGEVSEAERIRTKAMVQQAEDRILQQVNKALNPVVSKMQTKEVQDHFTAIREAHSDFDTLRQGPLQEWVKNMPNSVVRKAAEGVLQQGTTAEVIELLDMYKEQNSSRDSSEDTGQSTGAAPQVPASSQAPAQPGTEQGNDGGKGGKKPPKPGVDPDAVSATAAVTAGSRGADPRGDDPDDFQAGFRETASG